MKSHSIVAFKVNIANYFIQNTIHKAAAKFLNPKKINQKINLADIKIRKISAKSLSKIFTKEKKDELIE